MAEDQAPVYYEDLALLETQFDEVDREICTSLNFHALLEPLLTSI